MKSLTKATAPSSEVSGKTTQQALSVEPSDFIGAAGTAAEESRQAF